MCVPSSVWSVGLQLVRDHVAAEYQSVEEDIRDQSLSLAALSALMRFLVIEKRLCFRENAIKMTYTGLKNTLLMDYMTISTLELIEATSSTYGGGSVLHALDTCATRGGRRLLRLSLTQPIANRTIILARQDAVRELVRHKQVLRDTKALLYEYTDLDRLLSFLVRDVVRHPQGNDCDAHEHSCQRPCPSPRMNTP